MTQQDFVASWMGTFSSNYLLHAANLILLAAYSVTDVLWLRLLAVTSALFATAYWLFLPTRVWEPLAWSVVFAGINLYQACRLFVERRPVKLTPEEEKVRRIAFEDLPPRKVLQVLSIGAWTTSQVGERLLERGKRIEAISLIVHGRVKMMRESIALGELTEGDIVGSTLILSGLSAEVDAVTVEQVRCVRWEVTALNRYLAANPDTRITMQRHLARDLARKVVGVSFEANADR